ncbi:MULTISPECIES: TatD family hydrolase [Gammaproteobacteria]|uniref:TatD family hydrolase n=1 Tax=Gammaproteobacteria TaxID=1236 RepID=UPI000DCF8655|nr:MULTISPECIES: TatD family hydrolase [Gammaproteobacteria]RTE86843.1 TatD family deoxyribonuclease [Aliidiomarina sp. B3213]TCZ93368.1 TatD family deoxyribonuclease [Lysobacter sp. N42]
MSQNPPTLIDSHCHLDFPEFDTDREAVVQAAENVGINHFVVPGVSKDTWPRLVSFHEQYMQSSIGFGLHPYFISQHVPADIMALEHFLDLYPLAFVGEIGLDSRIESYEIQLKLFHQQLEIAEGLKRCVVLHHQKTQNDLLVAVKNILGSRSDSGLLHAFSGSYEQAMSWYEMGFKLGVGGVITYARAKKTRDAISRVPLESLILETDSPDMPIEGKQGQRNEPKNITHIFRALCELRSESAAEIQTQILKNTQNLFAINAL